MAFNLKSMLVRFLQIYRLDPETLDQVLLKEADEFEKGDPGAFAWDAAASDALEFAALFDSASLRERVDYLVSLFPSIPESGPPSDSLLRVVFDGVDLDRLAELSGTDLKGEEFEAWFFEKLREKDREDRLHKMAEPRKPDLAAYFAWDFVDRLDKVICRAQSFDRLEYVLSGHLRTLFQEAHRCYLFGYETACVVLCGAILEESIRQRTGKTSSGLGTAIEQAETEGVLTPPHLENARSVMRLRNTAAHGSPRKRGSMESDVRATLINTRTVVNALFATTGN